jgi:hypothetical protein
VKEKVVASKFAENAKPKKKNQNFICLAEHPKTMQGAKRQSLDRACYWVFRVSRYR